MTTTTNAEKDQRGLALVSVLWGIAILSLIAAAMLVASVTTARVDRNVRDAVRAGAIADGAVNLAVLSLMDDRPLQQPRVDSVPDTVRFDGASAQVWIQDVSGTINLNFADAVTMQSLFVSAGQSRENAAAVTARILARRDPLGAKPVLVFRSVEDLRTVDGVSSALYDRVAPALTVFGTASTVNTDVAPPVVLHALPDMNDASIAALLKARDDAQRVAPPAAARLGVAGTTFLITAEVRLAGAHRVRTAVVQFTGDETKPFWFLSWN